MSSFEWIVLALVGVTGWFWFNSVRAREAGMRAARDGCAREGVQLLDDTVACRSTRFGRDDDGRVALRRVYDFEYSGSGQDRYRGSVALLGTDVTMLDIGEHRRHLRVLH